MPSMSTSQSTVSSPHHRRESGIFRTSQDRRSFSVASEDTLVSAGRSQLLSNNHQRTRQISPLWMKLLIEEKPTIKVDSTTKADIPACATTLIAVANSLTGWCQLSDTVAMFQEAWDLTTYENNEAIFPITNVSNKAFVLTELVELIKRHQASEYNIPLEHIAAILLRLQKVLEGDNCSSILSSSDSLEITSLSSGLPDTTIVSGMPPHGSSREAGQQSDDSLSTTQSRAISATDTKSSDTKSNGNRSISNKSISSAMQASGPIICTFAGTFPASYSSSVSGERSTVPRSLRNFRKSLLYRLSIKKRESRPISAPEALDPNPVARTDPSRPASMQERPSEDLRAMSIYQAQLPKLAHSLTSLPRAQPTLVLFAFLESVVCPFVLEDCQALLTSCVKAHILDKL